MKTRDWQGFEFDEDEMNELADIEKKVKDSTMPMLVFYLTCVSDELRLRMKKLQNQKYGEQNDE